jgi:rubrerythrin
MSRINFEIAKENSEDLHSSTKVLSNIYHKGQNNIWDGRKILSELIQKHGKPTLSEEKKDSLIRILTLILWGELVAWKTSALLAAEIDDMGAKLAATSQAHDEARHFYVMLDYMRKVLDYEPDGRGYLSGHAEMGLNEVLNAPDLARRILGMQLMVEPVAITIFSQLRENEVEPILSELLLYYEKDEARHIALGVKYLPKVIKNFSFGQICNLFTWQCKMLKYEVDGLRDISLHFERLGIRASDVLRAAEKRQKDAAEEMVEELGWNLPIVAAIDKFLTAYVDIAWFGNSYFGAAKKLVGI